MSYCESCDTHKEGVQWWDVPFETSHPPLITLGGVNEKRKVSSACKSCLINEHVPKLHREMSEVWWEHTMTRLEEDVATTVAQFEAKLRMREHELSYTDTGRGWALQSVIKTLPIDETMAVLLSKYAADTHLTSAMIASIEWLESDGDNTFRASATPQDNIEGQLVAVLTNTAMPELHRDYPFIDTRKQEPTTVEEFKAKLRMREHELSYTAPTERYAMEYVIETIPIDEVMAILLSKYAADAPLTATMITTINWLESEPVDRRDNSYPFRASTTHEDNIVGQLLAVLTNTAMPELHRDYPFTDTRVPPKKCPHCKTTFTPKYKTHAEAQAAEPGSIYVEQHMSGFCSDTCWNALMPDDY